MDREKVENKTVAINMINTAGWELWQLFFKLWRMRVENGQFVVAMQRAEYYVCVSVWPVRTPRGGVYVCVCE